MTASKRKETGSVAEFTAIVPVFLLFIMIPMIDLGTVALRTTFVTAATRDAVHRAIKARSFQASQNGEPSAKEIARQTAENTLRPFAGIRLKTVSTRIVTVSLDGTSDPVRTESPLPANPEPDPKAAVYQLEVEVAADVSPLLPMTGLFGNMPGLSAPLPFASTAREIFEDPLALTL